MKFDEVIKELEKVEDNELFFKHWNGGILHVKMVNENQFDLCILSNDETSVRHLKLEELKEWWEKTPDKEKIDFDVVTKGWEDEEDETSS